MKLVKEKDESVPVLSLIEGQMAVVTKWYSGESDPFNGTIIQRWRDHLVVLGENEGWNDLYCGKGDYSFETCYVRILQPGELLEV